MADIKWIKLDVSLFDNRKIKAIRTLPEGDSIVVIWLQLLCLAGRVNDCGSVYITKEMPYTEQILANECGVSVSTIQLALKTFQSMGMIEVVEDIIYISNWEKYQAIEKMELIRQQNRDRQKKWYENHKKLPNVSLTESLTQPNATDIDIDIRDKNKDNIAKRKPEKHKYGQYQHVLLTDEQLLKLKAEYPNYLALITYLDEYIEMKGYKAKNHYLAIKKWVVDAVNRDSNKMPDFTLKKKERKFSAEDEEILRRLRED